MNMFNVLYHTYIDQVKHQEIQKYNQKHRQYLLKSGKLNKENQHIQNVKDYDDRPIQTKHKNNQRQRQLKRPKFQNAKPNKNTTQLRQTNNLSSNSVQGYQNQGLDNKLLISQTNESRRQEQRYHKQRPIKSTDSDFITGERQRRFEQFQQPKQRHINVQKKVLSFQQQIEQSQNVVLLQCPEGCGRKFNQKVLQKHIKNCRKIFQEKRKPFKVKVVQPQAENVKKIEKPSQSNTVNQKKQKVPKWKKQSDQLRKKIGNTSNANNPNAPIQLPQDDRVQCSGCGRRFQQAAAQRHIPNCLKRNKK